MTVIFCNQISPHYTTGLRADHSKTKFHLDKCKVFNCKLSNKTTSEFIYFLYDTKLDYTNNEK